MWAQGAGVTAIVRTTGKTKRTAYRWRDRYIERRVAGIERDGGAAEGSFESNTLLAANERRIYGSVSARRARARHNDARSLRVRHDVSWTKA